MQDYEKLGAFYLGRLFDLDRGETRDDLLLYESKDLTTHAVCVGMTGSGKTGLCLSLLEEAAIDGIPAIAIDPKGDLGNLLLAFPELQPADFRPWIDESEAARRGMSPEDFAAQTAETWRAGLAAWGQTPERIARFRDAVEVAIYTPGSTTGLPVTVVKSFAAPPPEVRDDEEALRERISSTTSGLLALLGVSADPVRSREHILVSNILDRNWRAGRDLSLAGLIQQVQTPPFEKVGVIDLETFFSTKDRVDLALSINNLLASPTFASWLEGDPLDVKKLLHTPQGKPRLSIISIAHLSEPERMFLVTILLEEIIAWMRTRPGTGSLRAILYMDEVFGFFPPTANPPCKKPMLTLLKQARAYGLGVVLATQNPVDLDYKGLSNAGTWFLGRLQTERDKARVLDGLEGASTQAGSTFDRAKMEAVLAGLGSRVFVMNNVHDDGPVVFQTRWALSYLRGPLTRGQIQSLMAPRKAIAAEANAVNTQAPPPIEPPPDGTVPAAPQARSPLAAASALASEARPIVPADVEQVFLPAADGLSPDNLIYRPALLGRIRLHFANATYHVDAWQDLQLLAPIGGDVPNDVWSEATELSASAARTLDRPAAQIGFAELPAELARADAYKSWEAALKSHCYQSRSATLYRCRELKQYAKFGENEGDFRVRLTEQAREARDEEVEKLRKKYESKLRTLRTRLETAQRAVDREASQATRSTFDTVISFGSSLLGAMFGRKLVSSTNMGRAASAARSAGRTAQQREDVKRAEAKVDTLQEQLAELEAEFEQDVTEFEAQYHPDALDIEEKTISPRKGDLDATVLLAWVPSNRDGSGPAGAVYAM